MKGLDKRIKTKLAKWRNNKKICMIEIKEICAIISNDIQRIIGFVIKESRNLS